MVDISLAGSRDSHSNSREGQGASGRRNSGNGKDRSESPASATDSTGGADVNNDKGDASVSPLPYRRDFTPGLGFVGFYAAAMGHAVHAFVLKVHHTVVQ